MGKSLILGKGSSRQRGMLKCKHRGQSKQCLDGERRSLRKE